MSQSNNSRCAVPLSLVLFKGDLATTMPMTYIEQQEMRTLYTFLDLVGKLYCVNNMYQQHYQVFVDVREDRRTTQKVVGVGRKYPNNHQ